MLADHTITEFLNKVAGSDPVPGGGSVAALSGALASALSSMVAGLTIGKKGYEVSYDIMEHIRVLTTHLQKEFITLIDKDSDAYKEVFACFKLPKNTDKEKEARSEAIQEATKNAALIPLEVARKSLDLMSIITDVAHFGNRNAVTDACVAMMSARTAVLGALLNVRINLSSIKDAEFVKELRTESDKIEQAARRRETELLEAVNQELQS